MKKKVGKKLKTALIAIACVLAALAVFVGVMQGFFVKADKDKPYLPDCPKADLTATLAKNSLTEEDYALLYAQTGLAKAGVDRMLARGAAGKSRILSLQTAYLAEHEVYHDFYAPFICSDYIESYIPTAYLEDGDIIVTDSTHLSGWRMGHAGLVTDGAEEEVLQASAVGEKSAIGGIKDFSDRITFMILSPKADAEVKREVAQFAADNLTGKIYDVTCGVLTDKNNCKRTQCAHLVWYAYKQFGIDLDCNGGPVVTPRDLANSPYMEVVQVFGFDPVKLWK